VPQPRHSRPSIWGGFLPRESGPPGQESADLQGNVRQVNQAPADSNPGSGTSFILQMSTFQGAKSGFGGRLQEDPPPGTTADEVQRTLAPLGQTPRHQGTRGCDRGER
jgi:hypothetical protein